MQHVLGVQLKSGSREELLPNITPEFPYIASYAEPSKYLGGQAPWHWHKEVELFYIEQGTLEYFTPRDHLIFPSGSIGFVNSNVLHMTIPQKGSENIIQLLHIFDPAFISGQHGSLIEQKYVTPITTAARMEVIGIFPGQPHQVQLSEQLRRSFELSGTDSAYELKLRSALSEIWYELYDLSAPLRTVSASYAMASDKIKTMMVYIHEHYSDKISVADLSAAAHVSERECYRVFHECLHMSPSDYMKSYRLQKACHMLVQGNEAVTYIASACGLGSSSYFGKTFKECFQMTPQEYRAKWQDNDINWR